jgi:predicted  nucleic acid-binding Zn-ribbon protein
LKLLDVQELDSRIDALRHQLATMPEAVHLAELTERREEVDGAARDLRVLVDDLTTEQKRADADVEQVKARRMRDQGMIDAGTMTDPKALQRMLGEMESLQRRISDLEDVEIEVMERLETAQQDLTERTAELEKLERDVEIYITHLKPGEIEPTMLEIEECVGKFRPQMLQNNLVLEF